MGDSRPIVILDARASIMAILKRRLAALWFADIVGYSELSHKDESRALEIIKLFQTMARRIVDQYGGNLVKFLGDGALAEFPSTEAAVRAACTLRTVFADQTVARDLGHMDLHIGVHVGEIATSPDGDVYGDGVNTTARIMNIAQPGQVLVSQDVWHQLRQRKEFEFGELDKHELRGAGRHSVCTVDVSEEETSIEWTDAEPAVAQAQTSLFGELRRRHVFRVAVAYAIAAWLVTQIAAIVVPALFLPAWMTRTVIVLAMLGFPLALVLAWAFELTPEGVRRTPSIETKAPQPLGTTWIRSRQLAVAAVIVGVMGISWAIWQRGSLGPPTISASSVAILPFNTRGNADIDYLREGMVSLIATKLGGVEQMQSVDAHAVLEFLDQTGLEGIDTRTGRTVAERFGAGLYLLGNILQVGDQLHLDASIYESGGSSEPAVQVSVQGNTEELMELVDQLVRKLLAAQMDESGSQLTGLAAMTTDSLEALKAYLDGERELRAGRFVDGAEAFQRAVTIDPRFALAHYRLGITASWIPDYGLLEQALDDMIRHSARLSPPDRVLVQAFHALKTSQPVKARSLLRPYLRKHPDDVEALYIYGEVLFSHNDVRGRSITEAKQPFERVVQLDPDLLNVVAERLMNIAAVEGDFSVIDSLLTRIDPSSNQALYWGAVRAFAIGTPEEQEQVLTELAEAGDGPLLGAVYRLAGYSPGARGARRAARLLLNPQRSPYHNRFGRMFLFTLEIQGGRWQSAAAQIDSLKLIDPARAARAFELKGVYVAMPLLSVPEDDLRAVRREIIEWDPDEVTDWIEESVQSLGFHPLYRQYLIGLLSIKLNDKRSASDAIEELRGWQGESSQIDDLGHLLARRLEAHVARSEDRPGEALAALSESPPELPVGEVANSPVLQQPYELFTRAELLQEDGRIDEAKAWYQVITEGSSWFNRPFSPIAHLRLAEIYDREGDSDRAAHHYARFIEYWKQSDESLRPIVEKAERRLAELTPGSAPSPARQP